MAELRPNFFIIGAPKAGTTSLYYYLSRHPEVLMSRIKEPNFFSYRELSNQQLYYRDDSVQDQQTYLSLFNTTTPDQVKAVGEASVSYLFYPDTANQIKQFNPDARIIIMLRNPFDRAWSHYLMDYKLNYVRDSFDDITLKRVNGHRNNQHFQQYIQLSLYHRQLQNYLNVFDRKQIFIGLYDDLKQSPQQLFNALCTFLEIEPVALPESSAYNSAEVPRNAFIKSVYASDSIRRGLKKLFGHQQSKKIKSLLFKKPELLPLPDTRQHLTQLFNDDIRKTESLTGLNLSAWYAT